ncbi:hemolysin III family protein [Domibacillus sp. A3M-37]|uniref:PAQR family membrane homeostasis protein TrhA n=1 Tax=Domibacillus sp. A3M-37 TaxID=2962037 RepID=UPI0020B73456|nr:hemolysin III family protein [Domibacillus sp. A3M-37]MCP3762199.1 hemolysin III family protein [Domibacillus sp. A3M-37]
MNQIIREPINALTHLIGAILSVAALVAMIIKAGSAASAASVTAVCIFGVSLILLYSASTLYHSVIARDSVIAFFRRLDHSMIFVLIAGSYTPFCLISLNNKTGWTLFIIVSLIALLGIAFKMVWFNCPRWLSTALYIFMGWMAVFVFSPLAGSLETGGLVLLVAGGGLYTIGGVIYALKPSWMQIKQMGFHEIFHIFILLGSLSHFLSVFLYVL